jgi:hypothetical protein
VLPEMWKCEVAKGYDAAALVRAMVDRSLITPGNDGKPTMQKKIPGYGNKRVYALAPDIIADAEDERSGNAGQLVS